MSTFVRRVVVLAVGLVVLGLGALVIVAIRAVVTEDRPAEISLIQTVEGEVDAELDATWKRFSERFEARMTCIDDVSVELVRWIEDADSAYLAGKSRIEIRAPVEADRFRELLARELARHLEETCDEFDELDDALGASRGEYVDAVVELVSGGEQMADDAVVAVIAAWGAGDPLD